MSEKLSGFKRLIGGLGKRIYNWKETKESMNFMSYMYETILWEYADLFNGNYEKAMDLLIELVKPMCEEVVSKLLGESVLGVSFKSLLTKNPTDLTYIVETVLYAVFGSWSEKVFRKPIYLSAEKSDQKVDTIILELTQCPFCCNTIIDPATLTPHKYGKLLVLTIEQMLQATQDYVGTDRTVVAREVRCFLNGDSNGEIRLWLYPKDKLDLMKANNYLTQIK
jgi:hypothetical protein